MPTCSDKFHVFIGSANFIPGISRCECGTLTAPDRPLVPKPPFHAIETYGDCVSCDGYRINPEDGEYCPTCARLQREGKTL